MKRLLIAVLLFVTCSGTAHSETAEEWIALGKRVHGGFGTYLVLGIRIGLDAQKRLDAKPRELDVTYQDGTTAPCACVADGIMLATVATPGQNSLRILPNKSGIRTFGVAIIKHRTKGTVLRYVIPATAQAELDRWNKEKDERGRYDAVMDAPVATIFTVETVYEGKKPENKAKR
jgi:formylmethanofuran dehydrogenase subunit E